MAKPIFMVISFASFVIFPTGRGWAADSNAGLPKNSRVSRVAPELYQKELAPHLTPISDALKNRSTSAVAAFASETDYLLREEIIRVNDDGSFMRVEHVVAQPRDKASMERNQEQDFQFLESRDQMHVVLAETLAGDQGERAVPVAEDGAFLRRTESDAKIHSDAMELHLIFPKLEEGAILHWIIVKERKVPVWPEEFWHSNTWGRQGITGLQRLVIDLPDALMKKLRWDAVGIRLPEPERVESSIGRTRLTWRMAGLGRVAWEPNGPPIDEIAPILRLSTVESWDALGRWFAEIARLQSEPLEPMRVLAHEWADALDPGKILSQLHTKVASEIRYTGIEFGDGAYAPRPPEEVISSKYGDCKDKANLLRVLLAARGIPSRLALLKTTGSTIAHPKLPAVSGIDHAILAVSLPGRKEPILCDPTFAHSKPGELPRTLGNRFALLIDTDGKTEWMRIPQQRAVTSDQMVDLYWTPKGASGWARCTYGGEAASNMLGGLPAMARKEILRLLPILLHMRGAKAMDYRIEDCSTDFESRATLTVFLVDPSNLGRTKKSLEFPSLFSSETSEDSPRVTPFRTDREDEKRTFVFRLPDAWECGELPGAFERKGTGFELSCRWNHGNGVLVGKGTVRVTKESFSPSDYDIFRKAGRDIGEWCRDGVPLTRKTPADSSKAPGSEPLILYVNLEEAPIDWEIFFPKLLTPEGQYELLLFRHPFSTSIATINMDLFCELGKRISEYWPSYPPARFMGLLGKCLTEDVADSVYEELTECAKQVDPSLAGLGRVILTGQLLDKEQMDRAKALAQSVADDASMSRAIRGMASFILATAVEADPSACFKAASQALEWGLVMDESLVLAAQYLWKSLAKLPHGDQASLEKTWDDMARNQRDRWPQIQSALIAIPAAAIDENDLATAHKHMAVLERVHARTPFTEDDLGLFQEQVEAVQNAVRYTPLHHRLREKFLALGLNTVPNADEKSNGASDMEGSCTDAETLGELLALVPVALVGFGPQANHGEMATSLASELTSKLEELKHDTENSQITAAADVERAMHLIDVILECVSGIKELAGDIALTRAYIETYRQPDGGLHFLRKAVIDDPALLGDRSVVETLVHSELDRDEFSNAMRALESVPADAAFFIDASLRAICLRLARGQSAEAMAVLEKVESISDRLADSLDMEDEAVAAAIDALKGNRSETIAWWDAGHRWHSDWVQFEETLDIANSILRTRPSELVTALPPNVASEADIYNIQEAIYNARWFKGHAEASVAYLRRNADHFGETAATILAVADHIEAALQRTVSR